ncbi:MAG: GGDEF domain-containing protein [Campylobacteraceae bacterium]|nr:GGDEF domain-containing protein [Campylobacteraceae bacterium]
MLNDKWIKIIKKLDFAFQPIVNTKSGKLYAVEALLRNVKSAGNFPSIFSLFDDAFHDGILYQLDLELRKMAFKKFAKLNIKNIQLFYNLDNRLLYMLDFSYGNTSKLLESLNLNKKAICFELSERGTMQDPSSITNMINRYKQEGFDIAIDDFGTGIAGFQLLYYSETNFIKIDRFFIDNIDSDSKKRLFSSSIISMAHIMGIKVIAEGIETEKEYYVCKDLGADFLQGYFVQKPTTELGKIKSAYEKIKTIFEKDKRNLNANLIDKTRIDKILPLNVNSNLGKLFKYFKENPLNTFVPLIDNFNQLKGVIYEEDIKELLYSPYGISLAKHDESGEKLKQYIKEIVSVEITWTVDKVLDIYNMYSNSAKVIFVTKNSQYYGFINLQNLLALSYKRNLEIASDQNPLTKLPGNKKIDEFLDKIFKLKEKNIYHVVYFDFNDFKPFNDLYGFRQGDRAILLFADILRKKILNDGFVAHIGGDDFFAGFEKCQLQDICRQIDKIIRLFRDRIKELYNKGDRDRGFIVTKDRFGIIREFELLSISSAVVEISSKSKKKNFDLMIGKIKKESKEYNNSLCTSIC